MKTNKNLTTTAICKKCCKIFCGFSINLKKERLIFKILLGKDDIFTKYTLEVIVQAELEVH